MALGKFKERIELEKKEAIDGDSCIVQMLFLMRRIVSTETTDAHWPDVVRFFDGYLRTSKEVLQVLRGTITTMDEMDEMVALCDVVSSIHHILDDTLNIIKGSNGLNKKVQEAVRKEYRQAVHILKKNSFGSDVICTTWLSKLEGLRSLRERRTLEKAVRHCHDPTHNIKCAALLAYIGKVTRKMTVAIRQEWTAVERKLVRDIEHWYAAALAGGLTSSCYLALERLTDITEETGIDLVDEEDEDEGEEEDEDEEEIQQIVLESFYDAFDLA